MGKAEVTKKIIVDTATELLRRNGKVTVKDITDASGVNIASVNYHFEDKDTLISVVIDEIFEDGERGVKELVGNASKKMMNRKELVRMAVDILFEFVDRNYGVFRYVLSKDYDLSKPLLQHLLQRVHNVFELVEPLLKEIMPELESNVLEMKFHIVFSSYIIPYLYFKEHYADCEDEGAKEEYKQRYIHEMYKILLTD